MMDLQISMDSFARLQDIIREPSANLTAAFLLLAILTLLLLMAVVAALLVILRTRPASKTPVEAQPAGENTALDSDESKTTGSRVTHNLMVFALVVGGVALLWIALGISSSDRFVCDSCHSDSPHAGSEALDPHLNVDCVVCHESGGAVQRATINLPVRVQHVMLGSIAPAEAAEYGRPISSWGCGDCHETDIAVTFVDADRGVSMSHVEPVAAGAACMDCHVLEAGVVSRQTVGHDPCMRCHGTEQVSGDCGYCHEGDPAHAIRASSEARDAYAREQVPEPTCGGCHAENTCDACHGIRMPHTVAFKATGHARHAAIDIWTNGGRTCRKCHYEGHQDCSECHAGPFPSHALTWRYDHQNAVDSPAACSCHLTNPLISDPNRSLCDICHDPAYQVDN